MFLFYLQIDSEDNNVIVDEDYLFLSHQLQLFGKIAFVRN